MELRVGGGGEHVVGAKVAFPSHPRSGSVTIEDRLHGYPGVSVVVPKRIMDNTRSELRVAREQLTEGTCVWASRVGSRVVHLRLVPLDQALYALEVAAVTGRVAVVQTYHARCGRSGYGVDLCHVAVVLQLALGAQLLEDLGVFAIAAVSDVVLEDSAEKCRAPLAEVMSAAIAALPDAVSAPAPASSSIRVVAASAALNPKP